MLLYSENGLERNRKKMAKRIHSGRKGKRMNSWAAAMKVASRRMKIKPPIKKGTAAYNMVKSIAASLKRSRF